jgi:Mitochondrial carrier protein
MFFRRRPCSAAVAVFAVVFSLEICSWRSCRSTAGLACPLAHALPLDSTNVTIDDQNVRTAHNTTILPGSVAQDRSLSSEPAAVPYNLGKILRKACNKALGGGIPGAIAGVIQVVALMWLRTVINHQARYGTSFVQSMKFLHKDGGIPRFYSGLGFALIQAPVTRFVATASNDGVLSLLSNLPATKLWGPGITTMFASTVVGFFRILLMPIDTCKTVLQVDSQEGFRNLMKRVRQGKISVLYAGSIATAVSAMVGHYPWFVCFNFLKHAEWLRLLIPSSLLRNAAIGLVSSIASDAVVNVFRVVKTFKQTMGSKHDMSYKETVQMILAADGWKGLFGRGLRTRIFANALQSILFTVIWRGLAEYWGNKEDGVNANGGNSGSIQTGIRGAQTVVAKPSQENPEDLIDLPYHGLLEHRALNSTAR